MAVHISRAAGARIAAACLVFFALAAAAAEPSEARRQLAAMNIEATPARLVQYAAQGDMTTTDLLLAAGVPATAAEPIHHATALHAAAAQGHLALARKLLDSGAAVDALDDRGVTPLVNAAYYGRDSVVALLLERGANPNTQPKASPTPLTAAVQSDQPAVVERLLRAGAKPDQADYTDTTPIAAAERSNRTAMLQKLREAETARRATGATR